MERVLIVDDNRDMQFLLAGILRDAGYETAVVGDGVAALTEIEKRSPDLVLLDVRLPGMDGTQVLAKIRQTTKELAVIMLTAYGDVRGAVNTVKLGAFDYLTKPFDNDVLLLTVKKALQTQYLSKEVANLKRRLAEGTSIEEAMGASPQIKEVLSLVNVVAPTDMTAVLQGESGTGKELIAQMIHEKSARKGKPFVPVDCGAIPETLVQSEMFGHEKGAFTGADEQREGRFEQANGGTLFLDEITNLPADIQSKFLRVLEERKIRHLGGRKTLNIDVRLIVATNVNLSNAVREGKFREDLFYRLNEFPIAIPSLRERKEDIPVLAKFFLEEANRELNRRIKGFSAKAMSFLLSYHWPGNARELKNAVRKAVLLTDSQYIAPGSLKLNGGMTRGALDSRGDSSPAASLKDGTQRVERELIKEALEKAAGNKTKAAKALHINRKALYRKLHGLDMLP